MFICVGMICSPFVSEQTQLSCKLTWKIRLDTYPSLLPALGARVLEEPRVAPARMLPWVGKGAVVPVVGGPLRAYLHLHATHWQFQGSLLPSEVSTDPRKLTNKSMLATHAGGTEQFHSTQFSSKGSRLRLPPRSQKRMRQQ